MEEDTHELQPVCEECEKNKATIRCEACLQSVCQRCCEILHPKKPYGVEDEHYEDVRILHLKIENSLFSFSRLDW